MIKKNKISNYIIVTAFVLICLLEIVWIFSKSLFDTTNHENRNSVALPELSTENYKEYTEKFTEYYNDNIPFRNYLVRTNSLIDYYLFNRSANENVIIGKDDWLFYNRVDDGDPIRSYMGEDIISETELENIAENCLSQRDYLEQQGIEFVIFIAPNKERIYYEKMPSKYGEPAANYRALQVVNYLRENTDVRVVYPYDELIYAKNVLDKNIWFKADTHWNWIGGYIGATALLSELGIDMPAIDSEDITIITEGETSGDLADMMNLSDVFVHKDYQYTVSGFDEHDYCNIDNDLSTVVSYCAKNADPRKIYVLRDSFCNHMLSYIGSQFDYSYLRHKGSYSVEDFDCQAPDIFVYETVERYVADLATFSVN